MKSQEPSTLVPARLLKPSNLLEQHHSGLHFAMYHSSSSIYCYNYSSYDSDWLQY
jgi:hypothetical protein